MATFEQEAYEENRNISLNNNTFGTLDDDLYWTRAKDNQVKTLSAKKANQEGPSSDVVCDVLLCITLGVRYIRRGESKVQNMEVLLDSILQGQGSLSMDGIMARKDTAKGT